MIKKISLSLSLICLFLIPALAQKIEQPKLEPKPSTEQQDSLIRQGVQSHDEGNYETAIKKYEEVLKENPDNIEALYEMSISYAAKKDCKRAMELSYRGVQYKSKLLPLFYGTLGNCLDDAGEPQKAIELYRNAIKILPADHLLHYNLAVTYTRQGKLEDARASLKRSAALNPNHPSSQLLLSSVFKAGGYKIPSLLASARFLVLEANTARSDTALEILQEALQGDVRKGSKPNEINIFVTMDGKKDEGDFGGFELFVGLSRAGALGEENKDKSEMQLSVEQFDTMIALLSEEKSKDNLSKFTWKYYVPYFGEMKKRGYVEPFCYYVFYRSRKEGVLEWMAANQSKVQAFLNWSKSYQWPRID